MIVTPQLGIVPPQAQTPQPTKHPQPQGNRKFHNFLTAFETFGADNFTPPVFNTWTGLSIIAGALERKVWLEWNQSLRYYPNLYVMLVGLPGAGKSTAINRGVELMTELYKADRLINFLPTQLTEAKMIELMSQKAVFYHNGKPFTHSSAYYFASEASDSLKEIYGDITSTMTNFYDCPAFWEKATKKDGRLTIENACFNLLAGSTIQFLGTLINENNVMGGFASRINYIICRDAPIRDSHFPESIPEIDKLKDNYKADLVFDLKRINEMIGPFTSTPEFRLAWRAWDQKEQSERTHQSEKMQSLLVRTGTSMHKLCMCLSAAEFSSRILELRHFESAVRLLQSTKEELPGIFREARATNITSADGMQNAFMLHLSGGPIAREELFKRLSLRGFDSTKVSQAIDNFIKGKVITAGSDGKLKLLINPNEHL